MFVAPCFNAWTVMSALGKATTRTVFNVFVAPWLKVYYSISPNLPTWKKKKKKIHEA